MKKELGVIRPGPPKEAGVHRQTAAKAIDDRDNELIVVGMAVQIPGSRSRILQGALRKQHNRTIHVLTAILGVTLDRLAAVG